MGKPAAQFPAAVSTDANLSIAVNKLSTKLTAPLAVGAVSMTVADASLIVANTLLSIDSEIVRVTADPSGSSVAIQRAYDSTTAAAHSSGATVAGNVDAYYHNTLVAEMEAVQGALGAGLSNVNSGFRSTLYNFAAQSPGGSLIVGVNVITLTPVPQGLNGSDANHYLYISSGTGTAEAVLIIGGTAVSGAASGTVIVTCANTHSGAWTIASATAGVQEAINAAVAAGASRFVGIGPGAYTFYAPANLNGASNIFIDGYGSTLTLSCADKNAFSLIASVGGALSLGTTVTGNINYPNRDQSTTTTLTVTSATGYAVGDYVFLQGTENSRLFAHINRIKAIAGAVFTMYDSIRIPIQTTDANSVQKVTLASGVVIQNLTFDGSLATGSGAGIGYSGVVMSFFRDCRLLNLQCNNINTGQVGAATNGVATAYGYHNQYRGIHCNNVGNGGGGSVYPFYETDSEFTDLNFENCNFGFNANYGVGHKVTNLNANSCGGRASKISGVGWGNFSTFGIFNCYTGVSVFGGSYRNQFTNMTSLYSTSGANIGTGGEDCRNNTFDNVITFGSAVGVDFGDGASDINTVFTNVQPGALYSFGSSTYSWSYAGTPRSYAFLNAAQSLGTSGLAEAISCDSNNYDLMGVHSTSVNPTRFKAPLPGWYTVKVFATFAANAAGSTRQIYLRANGVTIYGAGMIMAPGTNVTIVPYTQDIFMALNEYIEIFAYQNSGGALNLTGSGQTFIQFYKFL